MSDAPDGRHAVDLRRLVAIIAEELAAYRAAPPARCACHGLQSDCCPARVQGVLDAGAARLGLHAAGGGAGSVAALIDHTLLKPDATAADIETLCREAAEHRFATVCVNPTWVALAARRLRGTRRRRVLGGRLSARCDDGRREGATRRAAPSSTAPPRSTW